MSPHLPINWLPNEQLMASLSATAPSIPYLPLSLATLQCTHKFYVRDKHSLKSKDNTNSTLEKRELLLKGLSGQWAAPWYLESSWLLSGLRESPHGRKLKCFFNHQVLSPPSLFSCKSLFGPLKKPGICLGTCSLGFADCVCGANTLCSLYHLIFHQERFAERSYSTLLTS